MSQLTSIKKHIAKHPSYYPYFYAKRAAVLYMRRAFGKQQTRYPADATPLLPDYSRFAYLFDLSVDNFTTIVGPFVPEFNWFIGRVCNTWFGSVEVELYYSIIRSFKPKRIIEIGSGHCTYFAADALAKNGQGEIISIDPQPRRKLPKVVDYISSKVEDVNPSVFTELHENDILFIDSSHTTEEASYHCREILPQLKPGVIIHHHDFAFPYDIHFNDDAGKYGEPEVLLDFYNKHQDTFEVLISTSYLCFQHLEVVSRLIRSYQWTPSNIPSSLWTRKYR